MAARPARTTELETETEILIVDDDERIGRLLSRFLRAEGYRVRVAHNGEQMRAAVAAQAPDLLVLDLVLPGEDGLTLAREFRRHSATPIIMLTGKADTVDKVVGLELGADDYITKPFEQRELLARVRTVLRRAATAGVAQTETPGNQLRFDNWRLDLDAHELYDSDNRRIHLTGYEFSVLATLVKQPNHVYSRDELLDSVADRSWQPYDRSVDVLIGKIRRKIEVDPRRPRLIKSVRGVGYKFSGRVETV